MRLLIWYPGVNLGSLQKKGVSLSSLLPIKVTDADGLTKNSLKLKPGITWVYNPLCNKCIYVNPCEKGDIIQIRDKVFKKDFTLT